MVVMYFVDVFIDSFVMQGSVRPVVPGVLNDGTGNHSQCDVIPWRHGLVGMGDLEELQERVDTQHQGKLYNKMTEHEHSDAIPLDGECLWLVRLNFVFLHERNELAQYPWHRSTKIHCLMNNERSPHGNLPPGVVVCHVHPGSGKGVFDGVLGQHTQQVPCH